MTVWRPDPPKERAVCIYVSVCVCVCVCTCMHACMHACVCVHARVRVGGGGLCLVNAGNTLKASVPRDLLSAARNTELLFPALLTQPHHRLHSFSLLLLFLHSPSPFLSSFHYIGDTLQHPVPGAHLKPFWAAGLISQMKCILCTEKHKDRIGLNMWFHPESMHIQYI